LFGVSVGSSGGDDKSVHRVQRGSWRVRGVVERGAALSPAAAAARTSGTFGACPWPMRAQGCFDPVPWDGWLLRLLSKLSCEVGVLFLR